jgi:hypothetical protein
MWVFEEEKRVRLDAGFDRKFRLFLGYESGFVVNEAEPLDQKLSFLSHTTRSRSFGVILTVALVFGTIPTKSANKLTAEEETNTLKRISTTLLAAFFLIPSSVFSQTRSRSSRPKPPTAAQQTQRMAQVRTQGATHVAEQVKNLARFTYLLGGITSTIAAVDDAAKGNQVSQAGLQQNQERKATVKSSFRGFREGLDKLEIDFRNTPELQPYYIKLAGVAAGAATAEEQANANQFDAAGRTLLNVINRLADVLVIMRQ